MGIRIFFMTLQNLIDSKLAIFHGFWNDLGQGLRLDWAIKDSRHLAGWMNQEICKYLDKAKGILILLVKFILVFAIRLTMKI